MHWRTARYWSVRPAARWMRPIIIYCCCCCCCWAESNANTHLSHHKDISINICIPKYTYTHRLRKYENSRSFGLRISHMQRFGADHVLFICNIIGNIHHSPSGAFVDLYMRWISSSRVEPQVTWLPLRSPLYKYTALPSPPLYHPSPIADWIFTLAPEWLIIPSIVVGCVVYA